MNNKEFSELLEKRLLLFSTHVADLCRVLPQNKINLKYIDQIVRSSASIGANYIEANGSESKRDFFHRIKICRKEARETEYWLKLILYVNSNFKTQIDLLQKETNEYIRLFSSIINKLSN